MGYRIEAQSPNEVENIRQRVNLQQKVGQLDQSLRKSSEIRPQLMMIQNLLQKNVNNAELHQVNQERMSLHQEFIESQVNDIIVLLQDNIVNQTDIDEVYKYVKNTRTNVNRKLKALKNQIEEQNEKLDKIIELLEKSE